MTTVTSTVPLQVRVSMAHAVAQRVAELHGLDLLHIKGPALDPSLTWRGRVGTDADVLVRPDHLRVLLDVLARSGWRTHSRFDTGSPFGHSTTLIHRDFGYLDIHRFFPGVGLSSAAAFERLWQNRETRIIAGLSCPVPSVPAQAVIAVLHAARSGGTARSAADVDMAWTRADAALRTQVLALVTELKADVAFAAGTGRLEQFRGARDYDLWRVVSRGGTRVEEWVARVRAAPTPTAAARVALRAVLVNTEHLGHRLGREPTRIEVAREFFARPLRGAREELARRRSRSAGTHPSQAR